MKATFVKAIFFAALAVGIAFQIQLEHKRLKLFKVFLDNHETDRTNAGSWVNRNTPQSFRLLTFYGNPAYFSERYTYDASFLNMKYTGTDPISQYKPELVVVENADKIHGIPGSNELRAWNHSMGNNYSVVKTFYKTYSNGMNFYITIHARNDVLGQISNREYLRDPFTYLSSIKEPAPYGEVRSRGLDAFFVHSSPSGPVSFTFNICRLFHDKKMTSGRIKISMTKEARSIYRRDKTAATISYLVDFNGASSAGIVNPDKPAIIPIYCSDTMAQDAKIEISSNGPANTDWTLLSVLKD